METVNPRAKRSASARAPNGQSETPLGADETLKRYGVRSTAQRRAILDALLKCGDHVTIPALLALVQAKYPGISYTTVFRAVKLFSRRGLVRDHSFGDGRVWYEVKKEGAEEAHGHLVCIACTKIIQFTEPGIATIMDRAARDLGFVLTHQHHVLYGVCPMCRARRFGAA